MHSLIVYMTFIIWIAFEDEYGLDDAGIERFTSSSFNKFIMTDSKLINDQLHEFQVYISTHSPKPSSVGSSPVETPHTNLFSYIYLKLEEIDYHCRYKILSALSDVYMTFIMNTRVLKKL